MCGEIDEQAVIGQELHDRLRAAAKRMDLPEGAEAPAPGDLSEEAGRGAYAEAVFRDALARAFAALSLAEEDEAVDALALQAIALARAAGHLAGHLPAEADLYRAVIEAATEGHGEARALGRALAEPGHHHHHHHDHAH